MDPGLVGGLIGIGVVVLANLIIVAFGYGRLNEKVTEAALRAEDAKVTAIAMTNKLTEIGEKVAHIEGRLCRNSNLPRRRKTKSGS